MAKLEDILPLLEIEAKNKFPNLDLQDGTVEKDVFLLAPALLVDAEDKVQTYIRRTSTPSAFRTLLDDTDFRSEELPAVYGVTTESQADEILSDEVDSFAANYGLTRQEGTRATGTISLYFSSANPVSITAGSVISTDTNPRTRFAITRSFSGSPTVSGDTFKLTLAVEAVEAGQSGNVPANNINIPESAIPNLISANNEQDTAGGVDIETDEALMDRVVAKFQGSAIDTVEGLRSKVLNAGAFDAAVFRVGDPVTRNRPGPDILVVDETVEVVTDSFTWEANSIAGIIPEIQPVVDDINLLSLSGHPGAQFLIVKDTTVNERSVRAEDRIVVYGSDLPVIGEAVNLSYGANTNITAFQSLFQAPNDELFFDILVKTALRQDIRIDMSVVLFTGIDSSSVLPAIQEALFSLINNTGIGGEVSQSDVIGAVENVSGVNRVNIPLSFFGEADAVGTVVDNAITAGSTEYLRISSDNLTITVL